MTRLGRADRNHPGDNPRSASEPGAERWNDHDFDDLDGAGGSSPNLDTLSATAAVPDDMPTLLWALCSALESAQSPEAILAWPLTRLPRKSCDAVTEFSLLRDSKEASLRVRRGRLRVMGSYSSPGHERSRK